MARRRRKTKVKGKGLGYHDLQRFALTHCISGKRIYTSPVDVLLVAKRAAKRSGKTCKILHGMPGSEHQVATCGEDRKCYTNSGKSISMRKLYELEQGAKPESSGHGKRGKSVRNVKARGARKTRSGRGKRVL